MANFLDSCSHGLSLLFESQVRSEWALITGVRNACVNAVPRCRASSAVQLLLQGSANSLAMAHLRKTRDDVDSLEVGQIMRFCVTDDAGAKQGEAWAHVLAGGFFPRVRCLSSSNEAFRNWVSKPGREGHAPMQAMLHLCKGAPSKSPRFAEKKLQLHSTCLDGHSEGERHRGI